MDGILNLYKKRSETPLERLNRLKETNPEYEEVPLSYLGRLDPMADGVLLVAAGEENKKREEYLGLPKVYEVDILFGAATDTFDVLGKVTDIITRTNHPKINPLELVAFLETRLGKQHQEYPPYSSKTVDGKPLHEWAREGRLNEIVVPNHEIEVHDCLMLGMKTMSQKKLLRDIKKDVLAVQGDFRQEEIWACWEAQLRPLYDFEFQMFSVRLAVSSGTYVRSIAHELGEKFEIPSLAYRITRTSVGKWGIEDSLQ